MSDLEKIVLDPFLRWRVEVFDVADRRSLQQKELDKLGKEGEGYAHAIFHVNAV